MGTLIQAETLDRRFNEGGPLNDADKVRDRATRLFALALHCRETGLFSYADELTKLAIEDSNHADAIAISNSVAIPKQLDQPIVQQQQQPQLILARRNSAVSERAPPLRSMTGTTGDVSVRRSLHHHFPIASIADNLLHRSN
jgi:hypothetical protein